MPIDTQYYLDNQLKQPLLRIFDAILGDRADSILFKGDHTRSVQGVKITGGGMHGLAKFAVVKKSCLGCKNLLSNQNDNLCTNCLPKIKQIYIERKNEL